MAAENFTFIFILLRRKSKTTLAEGINICIKSKRKLYEDGRLVYKFTLLKKNSSGYEKI